MKKLVLFLLVGLFLTPSVILAEKYNCKKVIQLPHLPKIPALYSFTLFLGQNTGDLVITSANDVIGLNINITGNGVTYLNTTVSLTSGESYTDCLSYLPVGTYMLTLSTIFGVIEQYEITVEDD